MFDFFNKFSKERGEMADVIYKIIEIRNVIENFCIKTMCTGSNKKELSVFAFAIWSYMIEIKAKESQPKALAIIEACRNYILSKRILTSEEMFNAFNVYNEKIEKVNINFKVNIGKVINGQSTPEFDISCYRLGKTFLERFSSKNTSDAACISVAVHAINGGYELFSGINLSSI